MKTKPLNIRLAMRVEGDWWVAYMAMADTMDNAKRLGSILMGIASKPERKEAFMALMMDAMNDAIKDTTGHAPDHWNEPQPATHTAAKPRNT